MAKPKRNKTRSFTLAIIIAALYFALGFVLQAIAFGPVQVRLADALYPLIAVFGLPLLIGTFFGQLIFNMYGFAAGIALGPFDLLSPFIFLPAKYLIQKFGLKMVPIHVILVAVWVGYLLNLVFHIPLIIGIPTVGGGEVVAELLVGVPCALAIRRTLHKHAIFGL